MALKTIVTTNYLPACTGIDGGKNCSALSKTVFTLDDLEPPANWVAYTGRYYPGLAAGRGTPPFLRAGAGNAVYRCDLGEIYRARAALDAFGRRCGDQMKDWSPACLAEAGKLFRGLTASCAPLDAVVTFGAGARAGAKAAAREFEAHLRTRDPWLRWLNSTAVEQGGDAALEALLSGAAYSSPANAKQHKVGLAWVFHEGPPRWNYTIRMNFTANYPPTNNNDGKARQLFRAEHFHTLGGTTPHRTLGSFR